ncbi:MAG: hypothetical protein ACOX2J_07225 [Bacillota bacterium]|jgi:hypothetical protein
MSRQRVAILGRIGLLTIVLGWTLVRVITLWGTLVAGGGLP